MSTNSNKRAAIHYIYIHYMVRNILHDVDAVIPIQGEDSA